MSKKSQNITDLILEQVIREGRPGKVHLESRDLIDSLYGDTPNQADSPEFPSWFNRLVEWMLSLWNWLIGKMPRLGRFTSRFFIPMSKGARLLMVFSAALVMLVILISYSVVYLNDVILYQSDFHVNEQGTFNPRKALNCEYALALFNTTEVWANPGIQVNKNDRIRINISGALNSSVRDVMDGVRDNFRPQYPWLSYGKEIENKDTSLINYCLSRGNQLNQQPVYYGTLLYTIQPESADIVNHPFRAKKEEIRAWTPGKKQLYFSGDRRFHKAETSGFLYFAVNDLVFDDLVNVNDSTVTPADTLKSRYFKANRKNLTRELMRSRDFLGSMADEIYKEGLDHLRLDSLGVAQDPFFLYKDNIGQLLLAVEIQRYTPYWRLSPRMVFRNYMYRVSDVLDEANSFLDKVFRVLLWTLEFVVRTIIILSMWMGGILFVIYLFYFITQKISRSKN